MQLNGKPPEEESEMELWGKKVKKRIETGNK